MIEQEWKRFVSTGSVQDYLNYKSHQEAEGIYGDATGAMLAGRNSTGRSVRGYGADHNADGHGAFSGPGRGI